MVKGAAKKLRKQATKPKSPLSTSSVKSSSPEFVKRYHCTHCKTTFPEKVFKAHLPKCKKSSVDKPDKDSTLCTSCGKTFMNTARLERHILSACRKIVTFSCDQCSSTFTRKYSLKQHQSVVHGDGAQHKCEHCGKKFSSANILKEHVVVAHGIGGEYQCNKCGKAFPYPGRLKRHMSTYHGNKTFKCTLCDKKYPYYQSLSRHMRRIHNNPDMIHCDECDFSTANRHRFDLHMDRRHGDKLDEVVDYDSNEDEEEEILDAYNNM